MSELHQQILEPSLWLQRYGDYLFNIALLKVNNTEQAEDLVQETLLSAYKAREGFKGGSTEKTWLTSILNNKVIDYYRKKGSQKNSATYLQETEAAFTEQFFESGEGEMPHWLDQTAPNDWGNGADEKINQQEFYKILQACIHKMPPKLSSVFMAKFMDETATDIICKEFELSASNYWVIIHRAKVLMRSCLEKTWFKPI